MYTITFIQKETKKVLAYRHVNTLADAEKWAEEAKKLPYAESVAFTEDEVVDNKPTNPEEGTDGAA